MSARVQPGEAVGQILFPAGVAVPSLQPHADALTAPEAMDVDALRKLAGRVAGGVRADALMRPLLAAVEALHPYRHERTPGWRYGTFSSRRMLVERLMSAAQRAREGGSREASADEPE